jgi:hypothetical protein
VPFAVPVTPASAHVPWTSIAATDKKAILSNPFMLNFLLQREASYKMCRL